MKFAAVIFDLDGTLVDTEPAFRAVAKITAKDFERDFTDELFLALLGLPGPEVERGILDAFGQNFDLAAFREHFVVHWTTYVEERGINAKVGAARVVEHLHERAIPYAIATSTAHKRARESLELAGLNHHFQHLVGGDEIENGKPAPDIYFEAAARLSVPPERCIAIEDSAVGVASAAAAGMFTIMIPDLKPPDSETLCLSSEVIGSMDDALIRLSELLASCDP